MAKFHINPKGEAGECKARSGACPFGGEEEHHSSPEKARGAFEEKMKQEYTVVNAIYRKDRDADASALTKPVKERMLRDAAAGESRFSPTVIGKVLSQDKDAQIRATVVKSITSQKIINSLGKDESRQVRVAVAAATNNTTLLRDLLQDKDKPVREAAAANPAAPKRKVSSAVKKLKTQGKPAAKQDEIRAVVKVANSTAATA